ncbi:MAG: cyanophycinase [Vicinamibacteria bacterium]|jgi:cyanophycinase|nr:cyanophycinase [Vicinamibacteria bacterium]
MAAAGAPGSILAVGGAEDKEYKREILARFVKEAGGRRARIAILPTASAIPAERATHYTKVFAGLGAGESVHLPIATREDADKDQFARTLLECSGVFITGGDQSRLVTTLSGTATFQAIHALLVKGGTLAGTSAGASAFSSTMITGGSAGLHVRRDGVRLGAGLGLITRLIIDQHFSQRERLGRLLSAVAQQPQKLGVGIDEDTAIVYYGNGTIEIVGSGQVFIVDAADAVSVGFRDGDDGRHSLSGVVLHMLTAGDRFDVVGRCRLDPVPPPRPPRPRSRHK